MVVKARRDSSSATTASARKARHEGTAQLMRAHQAIGAAPFKRTIAPRPGEAGQGLLRHVPRRVRGSRCGGPGQGLRSTARPATVTAASTPSITRPRAGFCCHTYVAQVPEDQQGALEGLVQTGSPRGHRRYPTRLELQLKGARIEDVTGGTWGRKARTDWIHRGCGQARQRRSRRFVDVTADQRRGFRAVSKKGGHRPGQRRPSIRLPPIPPIPRFARPRTADDFHVRNTVHGKAGRVSGWPVMTLFGQGHPRSGGACSAARAMGPWV